MDSKTDFENWSALWRGGSDKRPSLAVLRERTQRDTRRKRVALLAPIGVTAGMGTWVTMRAIAPGSTDDVVFAVEAWLFIGTVWAGSLWIARGTWQPFGDSTSAFLDLSIRRCRSALMGARFGLVMYFIQLTAVLSLKAYYAAVGPVSVLTSWSAVLLVWIGAPLLSGLSVVYSRRKSVELRRLTALRDELQRE